MSARFYKRLPLALAIALKDMRGRLTGFRIFFACLALGTAALAAVGSFAEALYAGMAREGRAILGGDVELRLAHRAAPPAARAFFADFASQVSEVRRMNAMARAGDESLLVSLKAVDALYPLAGRMETKPAAPLSESFALKDGRYGALYDPSVARMLGVREGSSIRIGEAEFVLRARILSEPDRLADNVVYAPRLMISQEALDATGLAAPGSLLAYHYRLALKDAARASLADFAQRLRQRFPEEGFRIRDRENSSPQIRDFIERIGFFLSLSALAALVIGGIGVSNAVSAHLQSRLHRIATLKCLGAGLDLVFLIYLSQILILTAIGVAVGVAAGAAAPFLMDALAAGRIPVPLIPALYPLPLLMSALYGFVCALLFSVWPLAAARETPPAALFRAHIQDWDASPAWRYRILSAALALLLLLLAFLTAPDSRFALYFLLGCAAAILALQGLTMILLKAAARLPAAGGWLWRILRASLTRPGGTSSRIVLALSLGLALLSSVALVDGNIQSQIRSELPARAPAFFLTDIRGDQRAALKDLLAEKAGLSDLSFTPILRGRITHLNGARAEEAKIAADSAWALRGDRGLTYAAAAPSGSAVMEGRWWDADYDGAPLLSLDEELARDFGLGIGDSLSVSVLGRRMTAKIANIRRIDWESMGINFVLVFSPAPLRDAPHSYVAAFGVDEAEEAALRRAIAERFPNIAIISVRGAIDAVKGILENIAGAARAASLLTLLMGALVLSGAIAVGYRRKLYEAVIFKVLGATRRRLLLARLLEYALLGLISAAAALLIGALAAWAIITQIMRAEWIFLPLPLAGTVILACLLTICLGLAVEFRALRHPPARLIHAMAD